MCSGCVLLASPHAWTHARSQVAPSRRAYTKSTKIRGRTCAVVTEIPRKVICASDSNAALAFYLAVSVLYHPSWSWTSLTLSHTRFSLRFSPFLFGLFQVLIVCASTLICLSFCPDRVPNQHSVCLPGYPAAIATRLRTFVFFWRIRIKSLASSLLLIFQKRISECRWDSQYWFFCILLLLERQ